MKRFIQILALVGLMLSGCASNAKHGMEGYVVKKEVRIANA
ncbi:hypothetical protein [Bacillus salipaludis]|uniref:Lipoprotein n=1 Tax=Bacillus salipaludis TaxID=2547811 RepID=A0ABW8RDU2_9BACI